MRSELISLASNLVHKAVDKGFDEAAVLVNSVDRTMVKLANSQPSVTQRWMDVSVDIYLARNKRIFILSLKPRDEDLYSKSFDEIIKYAEIVNESIFYAPLPEPKPVKPLENLVDKKLLEYINDPLKLSELVVESSHRERIDHVAGTIDLWYREKALATSKGVELYEDSTGYQMYLRAFSGADGSGQWSSCGLRIDEKVFEETSLTASRYAVESRNRSGIEPGVYDVILSPLVFGNLLDIVSNMTSAFSIFMGLSIFMQKTPGDKVASDKLTVHDAPHDSVLPNSTSFDDEGVPTYNKPLIEKGVWRTMMHNSKSANMLGAESTGNAGWIYPRAWNIVVEPGDLGLDEMIGMVKKGILITNNWYTRLQNYVEGIFSTISRDALFYIENGEIKRPVEKIRIADKLPRLLENIAGLGKDCYNIKWWEVDIPTRLPYVLVKDINVSKHML